MSSTTASETSSALRIDLHVSPKGVPTNNTLISGATDAYLVDTCFTVSDAYELAEWVKASGKALRAVLLTHAHPDHYFGMDIVRDAFPGARVLARRDVREVMVEWPAKVLHWADVFGPEEMPESLDLPDVLVGDALEIDGERIEVIDHYGAEAVHMTTYYVPSHKLLVAGDLVWNGLHMFVNEVGDLDRWVGELTRIRNEYDIDRIIPGHGEPCGREVLDINIEYLNFVKSIRSPRSRVRDIAPRLIERYPTLAMPQVPWTTRGPGFGLYGPESIGMPEMERLGAPPADLEI